MAFYRIVLILFVLVSLTQEIHAQPRPETAPDFSGTTLDGKTIRLSDFKGQVVILDFWASWCGPCRKEMPYLIELYNNYRRISDVPLTVLAVNVDTDMKSTRDFLSQLNGKVPFPVILDPTGNIPSLYSIQGMPTTLMIDSNGLIAFAHSGFRNSDRQVYRSTLLNLLKKRVRP